ncbi:DUF4434 domain-containing protein [Nonomuraea jiangxiensis]|uniref:DUF4434 domain-containing protein n=1 Tax=Nonomuraea jiangxiensis TaxID=633440 RepID=A0A1G8URC3_9ACTN|nr:DUF4434 domain-containing protein [Nonomuraea jiangxiensis]SDJ55645.1 hypothetical protein SAMN05421869_11153 [Nonomuraea jiangxiensis]
MRQILWLVVAVSFVVGLVVTDDSEVEECPARDARVAAPYPITGYWVMPRADACVTRRMVEAIHSIGADTLVTFGPRFNASPDPDFDDCVVDGHPCAQVPGKEIRQVYTYTTSEEFGSGLLRCQGLDRRIESRGRIFYRVGLGASCADRVQDLVLISTDGDGLGNLMKEAAAYGMRVFPGLPAAPQRQDKTWEPDQAHIAALNAFTARVLTDYRTRFGGSAAFGGVYQSFELAARDRGDKDPIIALYAAQHQVVAATLPGTKILVSPYIDARRGRGFPPEQVVAGLADIAGTRAGAPMAIAVQDGRGTGKVPLYGPHEQDAKVAPRLVPVVGDVSNAQAYYGATRDYVDVAVQNVPPGVELWVNVEAFEPTPAAGECGRVEPLPLRGRTTKARLDQQIMAAGTRAVKVISYGWDPFFTCQARYDTPSLADDIVNAWRQPIIVGASRKDMNGRPGVLVEGHNLGGATLHFASPGAAKADVPQEWFGHDRFDSVWVPYTPSGRWTSITATNASGATSTSPYVLP